ncbi:MAG TPA: hypothetical protein VNZ86_20785, partial [Bacteroidia bacterium]|nr:hypothetical protein [Bacteroidia bacterium]
YYILKKRFAPYILAGIAPDIFLTYKEKLHLTYNDGHTTVSTQIDSPPLQAFNPQAQVGVGLDYFFKRSRFRIEPVYRISIVGQNYFYSITARYYSYGLNLSYLFRL